MKNKSVVYVKFPKAGLGNMLLTWSRAYVFATLNKLEMHTSSWTKIHYGAWLRRESRKRLYIGYFQKASFLKTIRFLYYLNSNKKIIEPSVHQMDIIESNSLFVFNKIFTDYDFFKEVRPYKEHIKKGIFDMLKPRIKKQYYQYKKPVIGMHIRRGDFSRGSTITPLSFFIDVVNGLRSMDGQQLPVTVFTDAMPSEIQELTLLDNVTLAEAKPDILDILLLSESEIVVLSMGSTFSYWAAFLSEGKIIKHEGEWHVPFRTPETKNSISEIIWKSKSDLAIPNITCKD